MASTKAYVVQMCVLYLFALRLAYARGKLAEAETKRLTAELSPGRGGHQAPAG